VTEIRIAPEEPNMSAADEVHKILDRLPSADSRGMFTESIDKEAIDKAIAEIHAGGREYTVALINLLAEPGSEADVKPRYALHGLVNHVLVIQDEAARKQLCETIAGELAADRPKHIKVFLCQELGWSGHRESVAALGKALRDDDLCTPACMALVAIQDGAAEQLRATYASAKGKSRLDILHALAALAEPQSSAIFAAAIKDPNREIRIVAGEGLANIGEASASQPLLAAAKQANGWERTKQANSCLLLAERLAASGKTDAARQVYDLLQKTAADDSDQHVREAASRGLAVLAAR
jgi:hypothetical protein